MFSRLKPSTYSRLISKSGVITQTYSQNRALHVLLRTKNLASKTNYLGCFSSSLINNTSTVRFASTNQTPIEPVLAELPLIPDVPIPPEITEVVGEAALQTYGLGAYYTPVGWIQHALNFMHTTCDIPWWATIIIGTTILRCITAPVFLSMQRHHALREVHKKDLSYFDRKRKEAIELNDKYRANMYVQKQETYYAQNNMLTTMKMGRNSALQGICFASFFLAINKMAAAPLPSFKEGGFAWFTDLSVTDPYYLLPIITSLSTGLYLYLTPTPTLATTVQMQKFQNIKYVFPVIGLAIMVYLKAGPLFYVITTTWITFLFQALVKVPKIRAFFNIAPIVKSQQEKISMDDFNMSFILAPMKEGWQSMMKNRRKRSADGADVRLFQNAGRGPLIKTYKYDPTKFVVRKEIKQ